MDVRSVAAFDRIAFVMDPLGRFSVSTLIPSPMI